MVTLRSLDKALEECINKRHPSEYEHTIDVFLNENANISSSNSSKLHEMLFRMWQAIDHEPRPNAGTKSDENLLEAAPTGDDPRVPFLTALNRLGPCLINTDQLDQWWDVLRVYAVDSTGHRIDVCTQAKHFVRAVLSGSFYEYSDADDVKRLEKNSLLYGRRVLELFLGVRKIAPDSDFERVRFIRAQCRALFGVFAQRYTLSAFTILNEFFVQPMFRNALLDLVVEYLSESQNSKLFKVYETPFFESLLTCLERDRSRITIQLAVTVLSMLMVHICDKLTTNDLLFRIFAIFGRACSWQPSSPNLASPNSEQLGSLTNGWRALEEEVLSEEELETASQVYTIKVVALFTFLYGLFPLNTLQFCRQCDEYLAKNDYTRRFSDYWSRFMVCGKAERIVSQFRVDPVLLNSNEEAELANSVQRFQKPGSALALSSICMCRRVGLPVNEGKSERELEENLQRHLESHREAFQMHNEGHWFRELLLMRNELAFANFARDMSEQRAVRWQQRASNHAVTECKNEELTRQNQLLRTKVGTLELETQKAVRAARTIMRERSAYESKLLARNREFREQTEELRIRVDELCKEKNAVSESEKSAREEADSARTQANEVGTRLTALELDRQHSAEPVQPLLPATEPATEPVPLGEPDNSALQFTIDQLKVKHAESDAALKSEIETLQLELAATLAAAANTVPNKHTSAQKSTLKAVASERNDTITKLRLQNDELSRRCMQLEHELRARKVHEEERLNGLQAAISSSRPYTATPDVSENKFRGRGGAQGVPRTNSFALTSGRARTVERTRTK